MIIQLIKKQHFFYFGVLLELRNSVISQVEGVFPALRNSVYRFPILNDGSIAAAYHFDFSCIGGLPVVKGRLHPCDLGDLSVAPSSLRVLGFWFQGGWPWAAWCVAKPADDALSSHVSLQSYREIMQIQRSDALGLQCLIKSSEGFSFLLQISWKLIPNSSRNGSFCLQHLSRNSLTLQILAVRL